MKQCFETRIGKVFNGAIQPIVSMRNRPNDKNITYKYGKRAGTLKKNKHKDCNETV